MLLLVAFNNLRLLLLCGAADQKCTHCRSYSCIGYKGMSNLVLHLTRDWKCRLVRLEVRASGS